MKQTGIIMSGDHPRKILDGTKTMMRRTWGLEKINDMPYLWGEPRYDEEVGMWLFWQQYTGDCIHVKCPYGHVGDLLWVRETWTINPLTGRPIYKADYDRTFEKPLSNWKPSIHMFRKDSRIQMPISLLLPERLQSISLADIKAEGIFLPKAEMLRPLSAIFAAYLVSFIELWNSINGKKHPWGENEWVWVIGWPKFSFENTY